jgi:hypothetical protein
MTTVADFGEYTGVHGVVTVDAVPFADVEYDIKWSRSTVSHSRASKFSKVQVPGELSVKTTIRKALVHAEAAMLMGYSLNETPITGSAGALLTATAVAADVVTPIPADPATPSRVKITTASGATIVAGQIIVSGTDQNDNAITELFTIPALTPLGTAFTGSKVFKTTKHSTVLNCTTGDGATYKIDSIIGGASYTVGEPKIFDLVGGVLKAGKSITITQPDCWFSDGGLSFKDAGTMLEVNASVEMHDPDLLEVDVVG